MKIYAWLPALVFCVTACSSGGSNSGDPNANRDGGQPFEGRGTTQGTQPPVTAVENPAVVPGIKADEGREGGGGGGIMISGRVYTFSELGLKLENAETPFYPDHETVSATVSALDRIQNEIGLAVRKVIHDGVFSNGHIYQRVNVVDPALFNRMRNQYQEYVDKIGTPGTFVLAAYTEGKTTYLFPDFFAAEPQSRAIYLIHESAFFLKSNASLEQVLGFEIAVLDFLNSEGKTESEIRAARIAVPFTLNKLGLLPDATMLGLYLKRVLEVKPDLTLAALMGQHWNISTGRFGEFNGSPKCGSGYRGADKGYIEYLAHPTDAAALDASSQIEREFFAHFYRRSISFDEANDYFSCTGDLNAENFQISVETDTQTGFPTVLATKKSADLYPTVELSFSAPGR